MCSIFGFIARKNSEPSLRSLEKIVRANIARGPHSFGLAWIDERDRLHCFKQAGRLTDSLGILAMARNARLLIGHLRYATHGSPLQNINNHPHPADSGWIVHNGVIRNYEQLLASRRLTPVSSCDSESLGLLIEQSAAPVLLSRCGEAVNATTGNLATLGLWSRPNRLIVARRGNPLHIADTPDGIYLATLRDGLPGRAGPLRDDTIRQFTRGKAGDIRCRTADLAPEPDADAFGALFDDAGEYAGG